MNSTYCESSTESYDDEKSDVFTNFAEMAREKDEEQWQGNFEQYEEQGISDSEAKKKANRKLKTKDVTEFMGYYGQLLSHMLRLRCGRVHKEIMKSIEYYLDEHMDREKAIRLALRKYKHQFEECIDSISSNESEGDDDDNDDESDMEEENNNNSDSIFIL